MTKFKKSFLLVAAGSGFLEGTLILFFVYQSGIKGVYATQLIILALTYFFLSGGFAYQALKKRRKPQPACLLDIRITLDEKQSA